MFSKIFKNISKNTLLLTKKKKNQKAQSNKNRQSSFFDDGESGGIFQRRKKNNFGSASFGKNFSYALKQKKLFIFLGGIIFFIGLGVFLLIGPFLKIDEILVEEVGSVSNINQIYDNVDYIRGKNLALLNTQELIKRIKKNQNTIANIRTQKKFPNTLILNVFSYKPLLQTNGYIITENGALVSNNIDENNVEIPIIKISEDLYEKALFNKKLNTQDITNILFLQDELARNILGFITKTLYYLPTERELLIENSVGNIFIFDLTSDIPRQVRGLAIYSKEEGDISEKKYVYIDVRITNKLFLCDYENEFSCIKNLKDIYGETIFESFPEEISLPEL